MILYQTQLPPQVETFEFDLNSGDLVILFDEAVDRSRLDLTKVYLQNDTSFGSVEFQLSGSTFNTGLSTNITINIGLDNLNELKKVINIATTSENTYLTLKNNAIYDAADNPYSDSDIIIPVSESGFGEDVTLPQLLNFTLDMNSETLTLSFSETVNVYTLMVSQITIQSSENSDEISYDLVDSIPVLEYTPNVDIKLSSGDINAIKSEPLLASSNDSTFISISTRTIMDMASLEVEPIFDDEAKQVEVFISDSTPPEIRSYNLDMNTGELDITFSEYINVSSLDLTGISMIGGRSSTADSHTFQETATTLSFEGTEISLELSVDDVNEIKKLRGLAISNTTTFMIATSTSVLDMNMNMLMTLEILSAERVTEFVEDTNRPSLGSDSFDLNVNTKTITLHFNETIDSNTTILTLITLQEEFTYSTNVTLSGGTISSGDSADLAIRITDEDINELSRLGVCTTRFNCYISFPSEAFTDMVNNTIIGIDGAMAESVGVFIDDMTAPKLVNFTSFDLDTGIIVLEFDETVNVSTVDFTALSLDEVAHSPDNRYTLRTGQILGRDREVIEIQVSVEDLNGIKQLRSVCYDSNRCWIRFTADFIQDIVGNSVAMVDSSFDIVVYELVGDFTPDTTQPQLLYFDLDMDSGELTLEFDEPIRYIELVFTEITIANSSDSKLFHTLTGGTRLTNRDSAMFGFRMTNEDLQALKAIDFIATSLNDTYLNFTADLVSDVANEPNPVNVTNIADGLLLVRSYTKDSVSPVLTSFTNLDMDEGTMILLFTEPVNADSLDYTMFTLQSDGSNTPLTDYQLTAGKATTDETRTVVTLTFSDSDLRAIKLNEDLAVTRDKSWLSVKSGGIEDTAGNGVTEITMLGALQAVQYQPDISSPIMISYTLDLDSGYLNFTFDDVMDNNNENVDPTKITFHGVFDGSDVNNMYTLTGGSTSSDNGYETELLLTEMDLNQIKRRIGLATEINDTYISLGAEFINDNSGQPVTPIVTVNSRRVTDYVPDTTQPYIREFVLDVDEGKLTLSFSETVNISTLDPTAISLQNMADGATASRVYNLSGGFPLENLLYEFQFDLYLTEDDLNSIKIFTDLGTETTNTFLSIRAGAVTDMNNNFLIERPSSLALQAVNRTLDMTPPALLNFTIDLNQGTLRLTFSESVDSDAIDASHITLQNAESVSDSEDYETLANGGIVVINEGVSHTVRLNNDDLNRIKAKPSLAVSRDTTYISFTSDMVYDYQLINIETLPRTNGKVANDFKEDSRVPELYSFELLIGADELVLSFSETVNSSTLQPTLLTLHSSRNVSTAISYNLTGSRGVSSTNSPVVRVDLLISDLNAIKRDPNFGTSTDNTFLTLSFGAVVDMNGNEIEAIDPLEAVASVNVTMDFTSPSLDSSVLNLSDDILTLTFSETVNVMTFTPSAIVIQSTTNIADGDYYQLTGGNIPSGNNHIVIITLTRSDANEIKRLERVAVSASTTFLSFSSNLVSDLNRNAIESVQNNSATQITFFEQDEKSPFLESFDLLLDATQTPPLLMILHFSETVMAATLNTQNIILQLSNDTNNADEIYALSNSATSSQNNSADIEIYLTLTDLNAIQSKAPLGRNHSTTFISISSGSVLDMNNRPLNEVSRNNAIQVLDHTADISPPELEYFELDLNLGVFRLFWNEPVDGIIDFSRISFVDSTMNSTFFTLTGGNATQTDTDSIEVTLTEDDLNLVFADTSLATEKENAYIYLEMNVLSDIHLNPNTPQGPIQTDDYRQDITQPRLQSYDLDLNTGLVTLVFSETVNASLLRPNEITFQNQEHGPSSTYTLTDGSPIAAVSTIAMFNLSVIDLNEIKARADLAISNETTYIAFGSDLIVDISDNRVESVSSSKAMIVATYTGDSIRPSLVFFNFDLDVGVLTLSFDETVNVTSLDITAVLLHNSGTTSSYNLDSSQKSMSHSNELNISSQC